MTTAVGLLANGSYGSCYCQYRHVSNRFYVVAEKSQLIPPVRPHMSERRIEGALATTREQIPVTTDLFPKVGPLTEVTESESPGGVNSNGETEMEDRGLELLEDDTKCRKLSVKDYLDRSKDFIRPDGGPPRWFCPVECGRPVKNAPVLLFLPGIDGTGLGLIQQHKALGRIFEVRCMHIPVFDRTPFEGLIKFVEQMIRTEHKVYPNRPIYLVGDSFGGCCALAVASRNPLIDLALVLSNPATSFHKSPLQPFLLLLEIIPEKLQVAVPYILSLAMGDPVKMASVDVKDELHPLEYFSELLENLNALLPRLSGLSDIVPKETLVWKLGLLKTASSYVNSRLHAVKADVLLLASGRDCLLPSREEAERLRKTLHNCQVRYFRDHGHSLLLEDGIDLATIIKSNCMYRKSKRMDYVMDYFPPTSTEFKKALDGYCGWLLQAVSPVMLSTLSDGTVVRSLDGVPQEGPVLFVGYHMMMGLELFALVGEFLRQRNVLIRGLAHPFFFTKAYEWDLTEQSPLENARLFGAVPVTPANFFTLLSTKSFILVYPGGVREALHRKGEAYKLFWPERPEFVRMAARFGATIVPFAAVGEDDVGELILDYNDQMNIPITRELIKEINQDITKLRADVVDELGKQDLHLPALLPKVPGRFYYLFGKPIETRELAMELEDRERARSLYLYIKSEVENMLSYLIKKREEDPYRSILQRYIFQAAAWGNHGEIPTFEL